MAQGKILVETSQIDSVAQKVETLAESYHDNYVNLYEIVNSISELGIWQGTDNAAFTNQIAQFRGDFEKMEQLLKEYAGFLKKAASGYRTTQNYVKDQVGKELKTSI